MHTEHKHSHSHGHKENKAAPSKELSLLNYMLEHNKQHAHELEEVRMRIFSAGNKAAAELIDDAVRCFDMANEKLEKAASLIKSEE